MWMGGQDLLNIVHLTLSNCHGLKKLPPLAHLYHLEDLTLECLPKIQRIGAEVYGLEPHGEKIFFPSLKMLSLYHMDALEEWEEPVISNNTKDKGLTQRFPLLKFLKVISCRKLRGIPLSTSSLPELNVRVKGPASIDIVRWLIQFPSPSAALSLSDVDVCVNITTLDHVCKWAELKLCSMSNLERLDLQGLPLLKELSLTECENLKEIVLLNCRSLEYFEIRGCQGLRRSVSAVNQPHAFKRLRTDSWDILRRSDPSSLLSLTLIDIDFDCKMRPDDQMWLLSWFRNLSSIEEIEISHIEGSSFPSFMDLRNLHSLQWLYVEDCHDLQALPELPSSLPSRNITVDDCPLLGEIDL